MPRPKRKRKIDFSPRVTKFSPRGVRGRPDVIHMEMDEIEAIRLADLNKLKHGQAALSMAISRQTFDRVLMRAHFKLANAIIHGKIVEIKTAQNDLESKK